MKPSLSIVNSTVARKQIVALTGLMIWGFVVAHLAGNLLIYSGPETFNSYAKKLASLRPLLTILEIGLILVALVHITLTIMLMVEYRRARPVRYTQSRPPGSHPISSRIMNITGPLIMIYVIFHLFDFTFSDHSGPRTLVNETDLGLYGIVYNAFKNPLHAGAYIVGMVFLGLHLNHAIQSACQTFGLNNRKVFPLIRNLSVLIGVSIALLYISIPVSVLLNVIKPG